MLQMDAPTRKRHLVALKSEFESEETTIGKRIAEIKKTFEHLSVKASVYNLLSKNRSFREKSYSSEISGDMEKNSAVTGNLREESSRLSERLLYLSDILSCIDDLIAAIDSHSP